MLAFFRMDCALFLECYCGGEVKLDENGMGGLRWYQRLTLTVIFVARVGDVKLILMVLKILF